ncbi:MAG: hypothetical protein WD595_02375 [Waddliaceae bacterium]
MQQINQLLFFICTVSCSLQGAAYHQFENSVEAAFQEKLEKSKGKFKERSLMITGCARSGTTFITKFLKLNQLNVGHERDGLFGVVSWTMAGDAFNTPWGPGANLYRFQHIFHQVRHPLKTIASAGNEPLASWKYIMTFVPEINLNDPKIVKGAKYWYYWNLLAEEKAEWTYRIEDIENQIDEMAARLEIQLDPLILEEIPTNTNTRRYLDVYTWDDLRDAVDEDLFYNIVEMANRYGYDISDL